MDWGHLENRAFLRAYHALSIALLRQNRHVEAIEILALLVSVCPNDNLGARYMLMQCYLDAQSWQAAIDLSLQYPEDIGPDILYSKAVALMKLHRNEDALDSLQQAVRYRPNVAKELLKSRHVGPKSMFSGSLQVGGADEAFDYWERNKAHWTKGSQALELLSTCVREKGTPPSH